MPCEPYEQSRRSFIRNTAAVTAGLACGLRLHAQDIQLPQTRLVIPRWRGFNLTEIAGWGSPQHYSEQDFEWMAGWGFNFARLPVSYWIWAEPENWMNLREEPFKYIDRALELGRQYKVHLCLGFVRLPGYSVGGSDREPHRLFEGSPESMEAALQAACHCWRVFAERYRNVPTHELSFNLMNEPAFHTNVPRYVTIVRALAQAIRAVSPERTLFVDGANLAQRPVLELTDLGIVQSSHDYQPKMVTHYQAGWVPKEEFESYEVPTWPMRDRWGTLWDRERLRKESIDPWKPLTRHGLPVHIGEFGCNNTGPHEACLGWMRDSLSLWKEAGWGWALWNLRGSFGIVDSERKDVAYEAFQGHRLDRRMLELLREG